jgi:hypothetical protein
LRTAGFTEAEVAKWEKSDSRVDGNRDGDVEEVKWAKKGEAREWDRGKVVDEDGHVQTNPEWGRLK